MTIVIFACVHNAGRSQMAAAFFNRWADPQQAVAISAGTQPAERVHPEVVDVLREKGIDASQLEPRRLTDELARQAQLLITMGCGEQCPVVPGLLRDDWPLEDPKGKSREEVRAIRDLVEQRVRSLLAAKGWARAAAANGTERVTFAGATNHGEAIAALLQAAALPHEDIAAHLADFVVAVDGTRVVGAVGLERLGAAGLLRSLVVAPELRHGGVGGQLYEHILSRARQLGLRELYLMTTTAEPFFARRGFVRIERAAAEPTLRDTREWRELCPASAAVMRLTLDSPTV